MDSDSVDLAATLRAVASHSQPADPQNAEVCYRQALAIDPTDSVALRNLGRIRISERRFGAAAVLLGQAVERAPKSAEAHLLLAVALEGLQRYDSAISQYEQVLAIEPNAVVFANLANLLITVRRPADALKVLDRATALIPEFADPHYHRGRALTELGRLKEAHRAFERAVALQPRNTGFHRALANVKCFQPGDPQLAAMKALADEIEILDENAQIELHFALGKAYADVAEHERAFHHLVLGNGLKRQQFVYDEAAALQTINGVRKTFSADLIRDKRAVGYTSAVPVFVVGMPRSGTTLVEQILASHPAIFGAGEISTFGDSARHLYEQACEGADFCDAVRCMTPDQLCALGRLYVDKVQASAPTAARIIDKLPANYLLLGFIHLALPNARVIHTVRNPVDTCLSCFATYFAGVQPQFYDLGELGRHYRAYQHLMDHWRAVLPRGVMLDVHYEDIVANLEFEARRLIAHCGLEWDSTCLEFYRSRRAVATASAIQVRQPIYRTSIGRASVYAHLLQPLHDALSGADPV